MTASLNDKILASATAGNGRAEFSSEMAPGDLTTTPYNTFSVASSNEVPINIESFELSNGSGSYTDVCAPYSEGPAQARRLK